MAVNIKFPILGGSCGKVFVQRWMELLHPLTMDTYAAKLLNSHLALKETLDIIEQVMIKQVTYFNLVDVWAETRELVLNDPVLLAKFRPLHNLMKERLKVCPQEKDAELKKYYRFINSLLRVLEPKYLELTLELLEESFCSKNSELCQKLASILVTELLQNRNTHSLFDLAYIFIDNNSKNFEEALAKFKSVVNKNKDTFNVYIGLTGTISEIDKFSARFNLKLCSKEELLSIGLEPSKANSNFYVYFQIQAFDYRSAIREAVDNLNKFFDILDFYWQTSIPKLDRFAVCVLTNRQERGWKSIPIDEASPTITPDLEQQLTQTINLINGKVLSNDTYLRLKGLIQYINLSRKAHLKEVSFLNAWVALESFTKLEGDTIKNIKDFVTPIICIKYPYKILKNFLEDCKRVGINSIQSLEVWELLSILKNTDNKNFDELYNDCIRYELLADRIKELRVSFKSGKNLVEMIEQHKKRIEWHLQRLYRIRNAIVHSAESPFGLDRCLKHLNEYIWIVFSEVVFRLTSNPSLSVEDTLVMLKDSFDSTMHELRYLEDYDITILKDGPFLI